MRPSTLFFGVSAALLMLLGWFAACSHLAMQQAGPVMAEKVRMVSELELTDLCLFTEASYTRHPSTADVGTPFQDGPGSLEHFPTGGLMTPPAHLASQGAVCLQQRAEKDHVPLY